MHVIHALVVKMIAIDSNEIGAVSCHVVFLSSLEFNPPTIRTNNQHSSPDIKIICICFIHFFFILLISSLFYMLFINRTELI